MWKLYEHQLRIVGQAQARINQLSEDFMDGTPPSWCYCGNQAPQYMRPFHHQLITITQKYAFQMEKTVRNIMMQQAEDDAVALPQGIET